MRSIVAVFGVVLVVSCGGGSGGGGSFMTSVPGGKPVNTLTGAEQTTLCNDLIAFRASLNPDVCRILGNFAAGLAQQLNGASEAELRMTCSDTENMCLQPPDAGATTGPPVCGGVSSPACTATVAELTACVNDLKTSYHTIASSLPACSALTAGSFADGGVALPTGLPPTCQTLDAKCPGFFSDGASPPDGGMPGAPDAGLSPPPSCGIMGGTGSFPPNLCVDFTGFAAQGIDGLNPAHDACVALQAECGTSCTLSFFGLDDCAGQNPGATPIATCSVSGGQSPAQVIYFYAPSTNGQAGPFCSSRGGLYAPL